MTVTVENIMEQLINDKYVILGYIFGFMGSLALLEQVAFAAALGFAGALGGWIFEQIRKFTLKKIKDKEESNITPT